MKLADFDFRLVLTPQIMLDIACDNKDCPCQTPLLYDEQARNHFNDPLYKDCELELWSGYTDSKGTKIYEGDIVKLKDGIYRVWLKNGFFLEDNADNVYTMWFASKYGEVVGNIHENADLLPNLQGE